jgi:phage tail P2-like protein
MSKTHGLTTENLMSTLPDYLRKDETILALAESIAEKLGALPEQIDSIRIYAMIDELPEELLDILAYDFKVDWWDPNYSLEQKRYTLRESWNVHRHLGTKHAVETAISAIYSYTYVSEWFQYDGDPFRFTLHIDATFENPDPVKHKRVLDRLEYYKNLRSAPYSIEYSARPYGECTAYMGATAACLGGHMTVNVEV